MINRLEAKHKILDASNEDKTVDLFLLIRYIDRIYDSIGTCAECKFASFPYPHCMFPNGQVEGIVEDFFCSDFEKKTKGSKC